jgi:hypothetical protein
LTVPDDVFSQVFSEKKLQEMDANPKLNGVNPHKLIAMNNNVSKNQLIAPGREPYVRFPAGSAIFVPKGSHFVWENHYAGTGVAGTESATLVVYPLAADQVRKRRFNIDVRANAAISIPPMARNVIVRGPFYFPLKEDAYLYSMQTHMHLRGVAIKLIVKDPSGEERVVYHQPFFNFKFQRAVQLNEPLPIAKGSRLAVECEYDNSKYKQRLSH